MLFIKSLPLLLRFKKCKLQLDNSYHAQGVNYFLLPQNYVSPLVKCHRFCMHCLPFILMAVRRSQLPNMSTVKIVEQVQICNIKCHCFVLGKLLSVLDTEYDCYNCC